MITSSFLAFWPRFYPRSDRVRFVVDKMVVWQVFFEYFRFPCQLFFPHHLLHIANNLNINAM
jgi:hypothetical protein